MQEVVDSGERITMCECMHVCVTSMCDIHTRAGRAQHMHAVSLCPEIIIVQPCCVCVVIFLYFPILGRDGGNAVGFQFFCKFINLQTRPMLSVTGPIRCIGRNHYI